MYTVMAKAQQIKDPKAEELKGQDPETLSFQHSNNPECSDRVWKNKKKGRQYVQNRQSFEGSILATRVNST